MTAPFQGGVQTAKDWQRMFICHSEETSEKSMKEDETPTCKAEPPIPINGLRSAKDTDDKEFLFHGKKTCINVHGQF